VLFTKAKGTGGSWVAFGSLASSIEVSYAGAKYPVEIAAEKLELTLV